MRSVSIAVTTFRNPNRLHGLLANMRSCGLPPVPITVFEDPSPHEDRDEVTRANGRVCAQYGISMLTRPSWGCMHGIIDYAMRCTIADWVIYVPDDVMFQPDGLHNECEGILRYGEDFVGGIQAPYWNVHELPAETNGSVPRNPHWEGPPRKYVNLNGAGFSISRKLFKAMGGWPRETWRLDEWAGYQAWKRGMVILTLSGPPRLHFCGRGSQLIGIATDFHTEENWAKATGGKTPAETSKETYELMDRIPGDDWDAIKQHYAGH